MSSSSTVVTHPLVASAVLRGTPAAHLTLHGSRPQVVPFPGPHGDAGGVVYRILTTPAAEYVRCLWKLPGRTTIKQVERNGLARVPDEEAVSVKRNIFEALGAVTSKPYSRLEHESLVVQRHIHMLQCIALTVAVIVQLFRLSQWGDQGRFDLMLQRVMDIGLPLLPVVLPVLIVVVSAIADARVLALADKLQRSSGYSADSGHLHRCTVGFPPRSYEYTSTSCLSSPPIAHSSDINPSIRDVIKYTRAILSGRRGLITRYSRLSDTLGSVTILSCPDKQGVLSYPTVTPEHVCFFSSASEHPNEPVILDVSVDQASDIGLRFDGLAWKEHIQALRPLALNCYMNARSMSGESTSMVETWLRHKCVDRLDTLQAWIRERSKGGTKIGVGWEGAGAVVRRLRVSGLDPDMVPSSYRQCLCWLWHLMGLGEVPSTMYALKSIHVFGPPMNDVMDALRTNVVLPQKPVPLLAVVSSEGEIQHHKKIEDKDRELFDRVSSVGIHMEEYHHLDDNGHATPEIERLSSSIHADQVTLRPVMPSPSPGTDAVTSTNTAEPDELELDIENHFAHMSGVIIEDRSAAVAHLMTRGTPGFTVSRCTNVWDGSALRPLGQASKDAILELSTRWARQDLKCTIWAYRPVPKDVMSCMMKKKVAVVFADDLTRHECADDTGLDVCPLEIIPIPATSESLAQNLHHKLIFLGMISSREQPKPELQSSIEEWQSIGVRFVLFSPDDPGACKAFGAKLGLETDWNCVISLNDPQCPLSYTAFDPRDKTEINARLPVGVDNVRAHVREVDNVPLLVPLFANAGPWTSAEMIRILQENGEVVACLASPLNMDNISLTSQADIAIALDPLPPRRCSDRQFETHLEHEHDSTSDIAAALGGLTSALHLQRMTDMNQVTNLVHGGRAASAARRQALLFAVACFIDLSVLLLACQVLWLPPPLSALQVQWCMYVIVPLMIIPIALRPMIPRDKALSMPDKNKNHMTSRWALFRYYVFRFFPSVVLSAIMFLFSLSNLLDDRSQIWTRNAYVMDTAAEDEALKLSQHLCLSFLVCTWVFSSLSMHHRYLSMKSYFSIPALCVGIIVIILQSGMFYLNIVVLRSTALTSSAWGIVSDVAITLAIWCVLVMFIDEIVKRYDKKLFARYQRRLKLLYDTRLGMYSPR